MSSPFPVIRVALADDHAIVLEGLKLVLSGVDGLTVVGAASDGPSLVALLQREAVDLLVMDLDMPGVHGADFLRELRQRHAGLRILVLTGHADAATRASAIEAGANGFLVKSGDIGELVPAIDALRAGRDYMGMSRAAPPSMPSASMAALTRREQQILVLIARGATASDVAGKLNISPLTARKHRENLMRKLDVHNTAELTAYAVRHGVLAG